MAMMLPGGGGKRTKPRGHGGHAAQAVNLDTKTYVDAKGRTLPYDAVHKVPLDGHSGVYVQGHPVMTVAEHEMHNTAIHKRLRARSKHPHPNDVMKKVMREMPETGGMPMGAPPFALPGGRAG